MRVEETSSCWYAGHKIKGLLAVFLCIVLSGKFCQGQRLNNPFASFHDRREFIVGLDNRITKINERIGVIYGLYSGLGYGDNLRVKFSLSGTPFLMGKYNLQRDVNQLSRLLFASVGQEFDFLTISKFKVASYINAGFGYHFYKVLNAEKLQVASEREQIFPLEFGLHGRYQFNELFAFKMGGGWRFVFPQAADELSGFYIKLTGVVNPRKLKEYLKRKKNAS